MVGHFKNDRWCKECPKEWIGVEAIGAAVEATVGAGGVVVQLGT
jgi:hypothetical protein